MPNKLLQYVKKYLKEGFSQKEIRKKLLKSGYEGEKIEEAFSLLPAQPAKERPKFFVPLVIAAVIVVVILVLIFLPSKAPSFVLSQGIIDQQYRQFRPSFAATSFGALTLAADSVISDSEGLCTQLDEEFALQCETAINIYQSIQDSAQGRCDGLTTIKGETFELDNVFCEALQNECTGLQGQQQAFCEGIAQGDLRICKQYPESPDCPELIALYQALKTSDQSWCQKIDPLVNQEICYRFVSQRAGLHVGLIKDLVTIKLVREAQQKSFCEQLSFSSLKKRCESRKSFQDIFAEVQETNLID